MLLPTSWPPRWAARIAVMFGWLAKLVLMGKLVCLR
jgi:hypothetical protein